MLVATFRPTTESVGKTIVFENDQFVLEGSGAIPAEAVMELDNRGQLSWGNEGMRAWVGARAKAAPEAPTVSQQREPAAASSKSERTPGQRSARVIGLLVLAFGLIIAFYFVAVFDTTALVKNPLYGFAFRVNNIGLMRDQRMGSVFGLVLAVTGGVLMYIGRRRTRSAQVRSSPRFAVGGVEAASAPEAPTVSQQREPAAASSKSERTSGQRTAWVIGLLVLAFGLIIAFYFFAVFDTSVALEGSSDRVNNIGLMRDQQMGSVFGLVLAVAGGVLMYIGRRRTTPAAAGSSEQPAPAPTAGLVGDLERLTALHQSGALTDQEFAALKAKYTT